MPTILETKKYLGKDTKFSLLALKPSKKSSFICNIIIKLIFPKAKRNT
jgi:hypothetical protein